ncbi:LysE/ArgO family amino acid transporter [Curtobacterium sp. MCBD17_032]|uniref:LysE/ArgO family amino acid transporter n=1 Tax=Curtobacterium sp. MCBD17_032 TaxID=2175659 RepID=UPI000DA9A15E|nr:LysE family transporter [Curtobacterium sp. MCBD17_032]PZE87188.1 amino acid transporter [Curtobacterium sp. MCBD17_032]
MTALLPALSGLGTGLALIVAIGVQNTYLLRLAVGARLAVVAAAVAVCALSDAALIVAGVLGVGAVVERVPAALLVIRLVGAAFLLTYGVLAARRALRPSGDAIRVADRVAEDGVPGAAVVATAVGADVTTGSADAAGTDTDRGRVTGAGAATGATDPHVGADTGRGRVTGAGAATGAADPHVGADVSAGTVGTDSATGATDAADAADAAAPGWTVASVSALPSAAGPALEAAPASASRTAPPGRVGPGDRGWPTMRAAVLTMLVFTWANPHVYLDTLVFLGSVANQQGVDDRWWWTAGAVGASCLWFGALGFGGRLLRPLFARPVTWRVFDALVAVVMLAFGVTLLLGA